MGQEEPKRFLGIPYDWSRPTWRRIRTRTWNPEDQRILTPKAFGWGWTINFHELARRLRLTRTRQP